MPELAAFHDHHNRRRGRRDTSPDSVIDQCSSTSDTSLYSSSGGIRGPDPDLKHELTARNNGNGNGGPYVNMEKAVAEEGFKLNAVAIKLNMDAAENQMHTLSSPRSSFSYKEYQNQKLRSDRRRPASLDLNNQAMNVTSSSPRLTSAMKTSASARRTPYYQKGWSSERAPLNANTNKSTLMVYNNNWKALSSKWEDAERWIVSPVAGDDGLNCSGQQQNRTKSKSGPLGPHESESPVLTGVNVDYNSLIQYQNGCDNNGNVCSVMDHCIARSVSMHGGSELPNQHSSLRIAHDDKTDGSTDVSRRDMATQMSPESSPGSSPTKPPSSSILTVDLQHVRSSKSDIRDVQVDDQITLTPYRRSKSNVEVDRKNKGLDMRESFSKVQREEAKIIAWENLQKAKADAAMRKLEMKLEKKRSSSMDRIINKLQSAQKKAQEMRKSVLSNEPHRVDKSSPKPVSFIKIRHESLDHKQPT